ncbi:YheT family hydrolase [Pseudotenacibaculum haliotis]|uniref:YheT family hydrolase n=1 Tax=Pseudotenacibaculum haliotis TaxID=1862138 RepID=A0ABW5LU47_9FLAO
MPILESDFIPSLPFRNGHVNTVFRPLFMKEIHNYKRIRVETWDHDFIDLDFSTTGSNTLVLLIHGLEGSSESKYMISAANELNAIGYDTVSFNLRGCSGEDNRLLQTYHSGKTEDVDFIVNYLLEHYDYEKLMIVGYSLGGNLTLKYLGEYADRVPDKVVSGIAVSVPVDLASSGKLMATLKNKIYMEEFLKTLRQKVLLKAEKFPEFNINKDKLFKAKAFKDFDELYTAPVFGFDSPEDYWVKASSKPYLLKIKKPCLLITSLDDPFLPEECYPYKEAESSDFFHLLVTKYGGHVGFISGFRQQDNRWLEQRMIQFFKDNT